MMMLPNSTPLCRVSTYFLTFNVVAVLTRCDDDDDDDDDDADAAAGDDERSRDSSRGRRDSQRRQEVSRERCVDQLHQGQRNGKK